MPTNCGAGLTEFAALMSGPHWRTTRRKWIERVGQGRGGWEVFICAGQSEIAACLKVCYTTNFFLPSTRKCICVRVNEWVAPFCISFFFLEHPCTVRSGGVVAALLEISAFLRSKAAADTFLITHTFVFCDPGLAAGLWQSVCCCQCSPTPYLSASIGITTLGTFICTPAGQQKAAAAPLLFTFNFFFLYLLSWNWHWPHIRIPCVSRCACGWFGQPIMLVCSAPALSLRPFLRGGGVV